MLLSNNYLLLIWKDPNTRTNYTIGKLSHDEKYEFEYLESAKDATVAGWEPLEAFPEQGKIYKSKNLFPVFSSRLPDRKRRDIEKILSKYELNAFDEFQLLRKSGARLPIDTYEFVDPIFSDEENIERDFYIMGIRHHAACGGSNCEFLPSVHIGDLLRLEEEPQNKHDEFAIKVLTAQGEFLGYIPRYYSKSITERIQSGMTYSCKILEITADRNCSECMKVRLNIPRKSVG